MKLFATLILSGLLGAFATVARGELQVVPASEPGRVFAGAARTISVVWRNDGREAVTEEVRMQLVQTSSGSAVHLSEAPWKKLQVLPGQTVLEQATLDFPEVKAETRFLVKWLAGTNRVLGTSTVLVYPTNLLAELKLLAGDDQRLGVFDPNATLKPLLKTTGVEFEDLQDTGVADFRGKLALIGPFASREQMPGDMAERVEKLARKGTAIVWLQPPPGPHAKLQPSFRTVMVGEASVVVAQAQMVTHLADAPQAQLNLLHFCRLALNPEPPRLLTPQSQP